MPEFDNRNVELPSEDEWSEFRTADQSPIGTREFQSLLLSAMPEDVRIWVLDDYFPNTTVSRENKELVCSIEDHIYTKYWQHKFSAYAFSNAMQRAVRRLIHEGHPFSNPSVDDEDVHIFIRWDLRLSHETPPIDVVNSIKAAYDLVYSRADAILENSDSVLVLGKDTGLSMDLLKRIATRLEELGYYAYIIKDQPDKLGEGVVQKVMRYALACKFVIVENTESSGHLYEIPHVAKAAECVTAFLQESGKGATWMFEDAYIKHPYWQKFEYQTAKLEQSVDSAVSWAEEYRKEFGDYQKSVLPWMK